MNRLCTASAIAALVLAGTLTQVAAAPPTVVPSPGYDARLQESRKSAAAHPVVVDPVTPSTPTGPRHHGKRKR